LTGALADAAERRPRLGSRVKMAAGVALGVLIVGCIVLAHLGWADAATWADTLARAVQGAGPAGWLIFALAQAAVAMAGVIPASLLGVAAGAVYGAWLGFVLAAAGTLLGGWLAFLLARSLLRPWVERVLAARAGGRLAGLDAAVARDGWRFVCLLRISPIMPFALTSYALGLTRIGRRDYLLGSLASLPALAGYVGIGSLARLGVLAAGNRPGTGGMLHWLLLGVGILATMLLVLRSGALLARCGLLPKGRAAKPLLAGDPPAGGIRFEADRR
jgi:uncharacterized membrane protein YdjX (TVP38/TMEM64 family)